MVIVPGREPDTCVVRRRAGARHHGGGRILNRRQRAAAARIVEMEGLLDEGQATLDAMTTTSRKTAKSTPDLDVLVEQALARQRRAEAEARAAADVERCTCPTGGCRYCGLATLGDPGA